MSRSLFISDLHLDSSRPAVTRALREFLRDNRDCSALYILGDLFEVWIGDDDDAPLASSVRDILRDFSDAGPGLFLMRGNRDFLLGEEWCRAAGARMLPEPAMVPLCGETALLLHGDTLCTRDLDYQAFRRTARDPAWQAAWLARPLAERRELAAEMRGMSREANRTKAEAIMDVTPEEVPRVMREHGASILIHGHTHRPGEHELETGTRWVLGDWCSRGWYIEATTQAVSLSSFLIKQ